MDVLEREPSARYSQPSTIVPSARHHLDAVVNLCRTVLQKLILEWVVAILVLACSATTALADTTPTREYRIKAAFLYNFAKFVEWPDQTWSQIGDFTVCMLGEDPFGSAIYTIEGKLVKGRSVKIRPISTRHTADECQIVFVANYDYTLSEVLKLFKGRSVLTVGETADFVDEGGIIGLLIRNNKVRFAVNQHAALQNGLQISSQLLRLAEHVIQEPQN